MQTHVNRLPSKIDKCRIAMILQGRPKLLSESVVVFGFWLMQQHSKWNNMMVTNHPPKDSFKTCFKRFRWFKGFQGQVGMSQNQLPAKFQQGSTQGSLGTGETYGESLRVEVRKMFWAHIMVKVG